MDEYNAVLIGTREQLVLDGVTVEDFLQIYLYN